MCSEAVVSKASSTAVIFHIYILLFFTTFPKRELLKTPLKRKRERERGWGSLKPSLSLFSSSSSFSESNERAGRFSKQTQTRHWKTDGQTETGKNLFFSLFLSLVKKRKKKWGLGTSVWCKKIISVCPATLSQRLCPLCLLVAFYFCSSSSRFVNCV